MRSLSGLDSILHCLDQSVLILASRLTIGDTNDEKWLLHLSAVQLLDEDWINDLLAQLGSEWSETLVALLREDLLDLLFASNVRHALHWQILVHEAEIDSVIIEQCRGEASSLQNKLQIFDTLAVLLEGHRTRVIDVDYDIVERKSDNIICNLFLNAPCLAEAVNALCRAGSNLWQLLRSRRSWAIESVQVLLLNGLL